MGVADVVFNVSWRLSSPLTSVSQGVGNGVVAGREYDQLQPEAYGAQLLKRRSREGTVNLILRPECDWPGSSA